MQDSVTIIVYSLIGIIIIVFNAVEIVAIIKGNKALKSYDQLLMSLAISDLLVGLSSVLYSCLVSNVEKIFSRRIFCFMVAYSFIASLFNLILIGLDRVIAVRFPFKHRIWAERRYFFKAIAFVWLVLAIEVILFIALQISKQAEFEAALIFYSAILPTLIIISFLVLSVLYGLIYYFYMLSQRNMQKLTSNGRKPPPRKKKPIPGGGRESSSKCVDKGTLHDMSLSFAESERTSSTTVEIEPSSHNETEKHDIREVDSAVVVSEHQSKRDRKKRHKNAGKPKACSFCCRQWALIITCSLVILSFFICTLPFAIHMLIWEKDTLEILLIANSLTNPIIYFYKGADHKRIVSLLKRESTSETKLELTHCRCQEHNK